VEADTWGDRAAYGRAQEAGCKRVLPRPPGRPAPETCARVCAWLPPDAVRTAVHSWLEGVREPTGLVWGQVAVAEQRHAMTALPECWTMVAWAGGLVTIEAMGTQRRWRTRLSRRRRMTSSRAQATRAPGLPLSSGASRGRRARRLRGAPRARTRPRAQARGAWHGVAPP